MRDGSHNAMAGKAIRITSRMRSVAMKGSTPTKMVEKPRVGGKVEIGGVWTAPDADGDKEVLDGGRFLVSLPRKPLPIATVAPGLH